MLHGLASPEKRGARFALRRHYLASATQVPGLAVQTMTNRPAMPALFACAVLGSDSN
jgi:hypothetical protein